MIRAHTLRFRMVVLSCSLLGVLLAGCYLAFWGLLSNEVSAQLNRQLLETARPTTDIVNEPNAQDVSRLDIPGECSELLDSTGRVLRHWRNMTAPIELKGISLVVSRPTFGLAAVGNSESVRIAFMPFQLGSQQRVLSVDEIRQKIEI